MALKHAFVLSAETFTFRDLFPSCFSTRNPSTWLTTHVVQVAVNASAVRRHQCEEGAARSRCVHPSMSPRLSILGILHHTVPQHCSFCHT